MQLNGNNAELLAYDRRQKHFIKGKKLYAARVRFLKERRYLRKRFPTATEAENYGTKLVEKYKRLLAVKGALGAFLKSNVVFRIGPCAVIWVRGDWIKSLWPSQKESNASE